MQNTNQSPREALRLLSKAEVAFLLLCGWRPAKADDLGGDWTPPEDRENLWDRDRAITEARYRAERSIRTEE